jgi:glycosyltransferase involved in cell wall biosynthesis
MRIAQVAPLHVAVPPRDYGGTERCVYNLTEALVKLGHDVTLFATGDSQTSAQLVPMRPDPISFDPAVDATALHVAELAEVYRRADQFDVIHSHLDYLTLPFVQTTPTPTVLTLHGRLDQSEFRQVFDTYRHANYISISESQRSFLPDLNWAGTVHHALDVNRFPFHPNPGNYLAFVGRMSPEKGPDRAIAIAKKAGIPLKIAAKIDASERPYFESVIKPMLDHPLIEYVGVLNEREKSELMGKALALLLPIKWPEPFGIVFIESLACGTPVLTCPYGAVPEILEDGVTSFIRETGDELVEAIEHLREISRSGCREYVRRKFDIQRMAMKYLNVYSKVQQRRPPFTIQSEAEVAEEAAATTLFTAEVEVPPPTKLPGTRAVPVAPSFAETPAALADDADERALYHDRR